VGDVRLAVPTPWARGCAVGLGADKESPGNRGDADLLCEAVQGLGDLRGDRDAALAVLLLLQVFHLAGHEDPGRAFHRGGTLQFVDQPADQILE